MRSMAALVLLEIGCTSSATMDKAAKADLMVFPPQINFDLPAGWNPNSILINQEGYEADIRLGVSPPDAWSKNYVRSDQRGFFIGAEAWQAMIGNADRLPPGAAPVQRIESPQLELTLAPAEDPALVRVEFKAIGDPSDGGELNLVGASDGLVPNASIEYALGSTSVDGATKLLSTTPVLRRASESSCVTISVFGDAPTGSRRTWVVQHEGPGRYRMTAVDLPVAGSR